MSAAPSLPPRTAGVSELLEAASRIWRATLPKCLPLAMIAILCAYLPTLYLSIAGLPIPRPPQLPSDPSYWVIYVVAMVAYLFLGSVAILQQRELVLGGRAELGAVLGVAARRLPVLVAAIVLCQVAVGVGLMLLVVPGVYLAVCSFVVWCVVLLEPVGPWAALLRSVRLVQPLWWKYCAAIVIAFLILAVTVLTVLVLAALLLGALVPAGSAAGNAVAVALGIGCFGAGMLFITALGLVLYSAASSSD